MAEENKYYHGQHTVQAAVLREMPDMSKHDPYGSGGWRKAEPATAPSIAAEPQLNLGLPAKRLVP